MLWYNRLIVTQVVKYVEAKFILLLHRYDYHFYIVIIKRRRCWWWKSKRSWWWKNRIGWWIRWGGGCIISPSFKVSIPFWVTSASFSWGIPSFWWSRALGWVPSPRFLTYLLTKHCHYIIFNLDKFLVSKESFPNKIFSELNLTIKMKDNSWISRLLGLLLLEFLHLMATTG